MSTLNCEKDNLLGQTVLVKRPISNFEKGTLFFVHPLYTIYGCICVLYSCVCLVLCRGYISGSSKGSSSGVVVYPSLPLQ